MLETYRESWVDFLQEQTLCRRAGCRADDLALVAAKELIDNAFDASPKGVDVSYDGDTLVVQDFGPGLGEEQALAIFDVRRPSLSSKRWRLARRGALGNGIRVVMGVAYVSGGDVTIESRGRGSVISVGGDGSTIVTQQFDSEIQDGTRMSLRYGDKIDVAAEQVLAYAERCQTAAGSAFGGTKAVPAWFDPAAIRELARDARDGTSVLDFARCFDLTDEAIAPIKQTGMRKTTRELLLNDELLSTVTGLIIGGQKGDRQLKRIGKNALSGAYAYAEDTIRLGDATMPVMVEVWIEGNPVKDAKATGKVEVSTLFANRTPSIMSLSTGYVMSGARFYLPLGNLSLQINDVLKKPCNFVLDIAISAPELPLVSDGKAVDVSRFTRPLLKALRQALPRAYVPPTGKVEREISAKKLSIKDAVYLVIAEVYNKIADADIGAPVRMLFYKARPEILRLTGREDVKQSAFNGPLHEFMDDHPDLTKDWKILYDDRGHFIEPDGKTFGLGARAVDNFINRLSADLPRFRPTIGEIEIQCEKSGILSDSRDPSHRFGAVVFVEKEGYSELIRNAHIAERFDVAFASTKGMPNTSIPRLLDRLAEHGIKVFCLHDFDITGLGIAYTLVNSNARYRFTNDLDFVDMGVRLADAAAMELESEPFRLDAKTDRSKLRDRLARYGATAAEIDMLVRQRHRVEIDAMTPRQLIDFIETKLTDHGISKVVPSDEVMRAHYEKETFALRIDAALAPLRAEFRERLSEATRELRSGEFEIDVPPLHETVKQRLANNPHLTWREVVRSGAAADGDA